MKLISALSVILLVAASAANATTPIVVKAEPINKADFTKAVQVDVKASMESIALTFSAPKATLKLEQAKHKATNDVVIAKRSLIAE